MTITNKMLAEAVLYRLNEGATMSTVAKELAAYVVSARRTKDVDAVLRQAIRLQANDGNVELTVTTAHGLGADVRTQIEKLFAADAKQVIMNEKQDSAVLGGVLVESAEQRLDLTIRRQLQRLKGMGV